MKSICLLLLWAVSCRAEYTEIGGTNTVSSGSTTTTLGDVVTVGGHKHVLRKMSGADAGELRPSWCPSPEGQECNDGSAGNLGTATKANSEECMRYCKENTCKAMQWVQASGSCLLSDAACSTALVAGTGMYFQRMVGSEISCPGGVSPVGLPEDDFSDDFCEVSGKSCEDGPLIRSIEKPDLRQCQVECNSDASCSVAVLTVVQGEKRMCDLRSARCSDLSALPAKSSATTLIRMTKTEAATDPVSCPAGSVQFDPRDPGFFDTFCVYADKKCPSTDNLMYLNWSELDRDECLAKCNHLATCAQAEQFTVGDPFTGKEQCRMKDVKCTADQIVDAPGQRVFIRLGPEAPDENCPVTTHAAPQEVPWKAKFCNNVDKDCTALSNTLVPATDVEDCLTQCVRVPNGGCSSASFKTGTCRLVTGKCTDAQQSAAPGNTYYVQISIEASCPAVTCTDPNSTPGDVSACPNTCANPTASEGCQIGTNGCKCNEGYVLQDGVCTAKDQCPDPCPAPTDVTVVAADHYVGIQEMVEITLLPSLATPTGCVANAAFSETASACPATLQITGNEDNCNLSRVKACTCIEGFLLDAQTGGCVEITK